MIAVASFVAGALCSWLLWRALEPQFTGATQLLRQNYRGALVPVAAGVVVVLAVVLVGTVFRLWERYDGIGVGDIERGSTVLFGGTVGFGLIGLLDDLVGGAATKGFAGHLGALRHGRVTTGLVKLVWGVLFGMLAVPGDLGDSIRAGLLIAASANLANLFDRAPGRMVKVCLLGGAVVVLLGAPAWQLTGPLLVLGAGAGMLMPDLRERCMLGDTGANVLGAAVGYGLVISLAPSGQWAALAVVVALNLASEFVSFTRVIDAVAPLRWLDRLGSGPERRTTITG